jgi:integrase
MHDVRVCVVDRGRTFLYMRYIDPQTGKAVEKSTGERKRRDAERVAAKFEHDLRNGRHVAPSRILWSDFRERFEAEHMAGQSNSYWNTMKAAFNRLEKMGFERLSQIDSQLLSAFKATLHDDQVSRETIRTYLKHVRICLGWAVEMGLLPAVPKVRSPKASEKMKGRPITAEEFDRMLKVVAQVRPNDADMWERYLWGLWLSGLRRGESLVLSWDYDARISVDLSGRHPQFRILQQKSGKQQLLPMTPDFAEWLLQTPAAEREGSVFPLSCGPDAAGRTVGKIGRKARVVVDKSAGTFATAHDLRRSFGTRWSQRVMPVTLQKLMRQRDLKTTMSYYVQREADDIAAELWRLHAPGDAFGDTPSFESRIVEPQIDVSNGLDIACISPDDKTPLELFLAGLQGWEVSLPHEFLRKSDIPC